MEVDDEEGREGEQQAPPCGIIALDLSYNHHLLVPLYGGCRSAHDAAPHLTQLLTRPLIMAGLQRLELGHCRLGDGGLRQLLVAFPTLTCLTHLGLATNRLTDRGCAALFAALAGAAAPENGGASSSNAGSSDGGGIALLGAAAAAMAAAAAVEAGGGGADAATVSPTSSDATNLPSPPSAGSDRHHSHPHQPPTPPTAAITLRPAPLLPRLRSLDICDNGVGDRAASDLAHALALRSARLQPRPPPLAIDLRLSPMGHAAGLALVRAAYALQQRVGGMRVALHTSRIKYWG